MNRTQRKQMEKNLGLTKYKTKMSRKEKFEMIHQNIIDGNKKQTEMKENIRIQKDVKKDEVNNNKIASRTTELMISEGLSYIEALEKAKKENQIKE